MIWWASIVLTTAALVQTSLTETIDPSKWPAGTYGIPKPKTGCPSSYGFQWMTGSRSQDTNNKESKNNRSALFHLDAVVDNKIVKPSFCLKTSTAEDQNRNIWPSGQYCIYKNGSCPDGFNDSFVYWDDDTFRSRNRRSEILPDGVYDSNTEIEFCCRADGNENKPVVLPTKEPFYLLAYKSQKCQMVKWAVSSLEWIYYDTEHWSNDDDREGAYPYNAATRHPTIYYCYYRGCNKTLTAMKGTFHSPNYPNKHSDGEYCSWKISVSPGNRIRLTFSNPSFHKQNDASILIVYDGEHGSGAVLGVFYYSLPPPRKELYSSSNHMLVIFVSKATDSYTGFNASYSFIERRATSPSTISTAKQRPDVISSTYTENQLSTNGDLNEGRGKKKQKRQSDEEGVNVVAIAVPSSGLMIVALLLVGAFLYCRRKNKSKGGSRNSRHTVHFSNVTSYVVTSPSENADELYTEVEEREYQEIPMRKTYPVQQNENPVYESAAYEMVFSI